MPGFEVAGSYKDQDRPCDQSFGEFVRRRGVPGERAPFPDSVADRVRHHFKVRREMLEQQQASRQVERARHESSAPNFPFHGPAATLDRIANGIGCHPPEIDPGHDLGRHHEVGSTHTRPNSRHEQTRLGEFLQQPEARIETPLSACENDDRFHIGADLGYPRQRLHESMQSDRPCKDAGAGHRQRHRADDFPKAWQILLQELLRPMRGIQARVQMPERMNGAWNSWKEAEVQQVRQASSIKYRTIKALPGKFQPGEGPRVAPEHSAGPWSAW